MLLMLFFRSRLWQLRHTLQIDNSRHSHTRYSRLQATSQPAPNRPSTEPDVMGARFSSAKKGTPAPDTATQPASRGCCCAVACAVPPAVPPAAGCRLTLTPAKDGQSVTVTIRAAPSPIKTVADDTCLVKVQLQVSNGEGTCRAAGCLVASLPNLNLRVSHTGELLARQAHPSHPPAHRQGGPGGAEPPGAHPRCSQRVWVLATTSSPAAAAVRSRYCHQDLPGPSIQVAEWMGTPRKEEEEAAAATNELAQVRLWGTGRLLTRRAPGACWHTPPAARSIHPPAQYSVPSQAQRPRSPTGRRAAKASPTRLQHAAQ